MQYLRPVTLFFTVIAYWSVLAGLGRAESVAAPSFGVERFLNDSRFSFVHSSPGGAAAVLPALSCRAFSLAAKPVLEGLSLGRYEPSSLYGRPRQCDMMFANLLMGVGALAVGTTDPARASHIGAGSFDRFFRDALRSRENLDNFFDSSLGAAWHPVFASSLLLLTTATGLAGEGAYMESVTRALPLLWTGMAANALPTTMAKRSVRRERPFLMFDNQEAIEAFGEGDGATESFYSGHASVAFFSATFVDRVMANMIDRARPGYCLGCETTWTRRLTRLGQAGLLYGLAGAVAYSRIEIDKHFVTDVALGAGLGALHGELTYQLGYRSDREKGGLSVSSLPGGYGLMLVWRF